MVLLKYNTNNNDEKNSTNNSNNDPRQTIKHIQRLYFNKCSNEFYSALLVQQQQHQKQQQQQKEGQHQEEEVGEGGLRVFTIDTNPLPAGVYFLNFGRAGEWVTERVVVL